MNREENIQNEPELFIIKKHFPNESYEIGDENIKLILSGNSIEIIRATNGQYSDILSSLDTIEKVVSVIANIITISAAMGAWNAKIKSEKILKDHKEIVKGIPLRSRKLYDFIVDVIEKRQDEDKIQ